MSRSKTIVLINPGDKVQVYQNLGKDHAGIEPPFWIAVLGAFLRKKGYQVAIVDAHAENFSPEETAAAVDKIGPILSVVMVYGTQPSASTQNMTIASMICKALKEKTTAKVAIGGLHPSALPRQTLETTAVDFLIEGEGAQTIFVLANCLAAQSTDYTSVLGLWYRDGVVMKHNPKAPLLKNLDEELPIAAWDLLPMQKYRAHNWHCFDHLENRMSYAAIYTSLGCPYNCIFCCINALFGKPGIRYRSPELVVKEMELLAKEYAVKNLKIVDELFVLDERHYMRIVDLLIEKKLGLNIWAYARVDTVEERNLSRMKQAGINWLALGIESANPKIRDGAEKKMQVKDISQVVRGIQDAGIRVIGNFIFGLPEDNLSTMQETLDMAMELNCEFANFYCAMAYPGSELYAIALKKGWQLPECWHGFSQHSYETLPLPTTYLSAKEVLSFRDEAFTKYFENPRYLSMIEKKFGKEVKRHIMEMTKMKLKRRILEEQAKEQAGIE